MSELMESVARIVTAQAQLQPLSPEQLTQMIQSVAQALSSLETSSLEGDESGLSLTQLQASPGLSITKRTIVCLECGKSCKLLSNRHLALHDLTPRSYKQKWGIPRTIALSSTSLTAKRRRLAKEMGMGSALAKWRQEQKANKLRAVQ